VITALPHLPVPLIAGLLAEAAGAHPEVPILACVFGEGDWPGPVPRLEDPDAAAATLDLLTRPAAHRTGPAGTGPAGTGPAGTGPAGTGRVLAGGAMPPGVRAPRQGPTWLDTGTCTGVLRAFDIPAVPGVSAQGPEAAVQAAELLRYPLVVKAQGPGLLHKSDAGGVIAAVHDPEELRVAVRELQARLGDRLEGVLLQPQLTAVAELMVGAVRNPRTGPLILVGRGGVGWDIDADRAWNLAPIGTGAALDMLTSLRMAPVFAGYRGGPPVDLAPLARIVTRVSAVMTELPAVTELDLNPVMVTAGGPVVVDVRIRVAPDATMPGLDQIRRLRGPA
jgi:hypothetical protein